MATTSIRPLTVKEKSAVMRILQTTPEFLAPEVIIAEELIDAFLEDTETSGYYFYIAEHDGEIAGYVCYGNTPLTEATWDLYWIAVANNKQGFFITSDIYSFPLADCEKVSSVMRPDDLTL